MEIVLKVSGYRWAARLKRFLQLMINRLLYGWHRYGEPQAVQDYLLRLKGAIDRYEATGNLEYLVDAANYAWLEFECPLHPKAHFTCEDSRGRNVRRELSA
jgi:hypothetical protein